MQLDASSTGSGSIRIEGFQVSQSVDSPFTRLVVASAPRRPAAESPFSRLLKADSAPHGGAAGGLKLKLPPRALKTAASTCAPAVEPTPSVPCLRKAQSAVLGGLPTLASAGSAPVPVPTAGSCRRVPEPLPLRQALRVMSGTRQLRARTGWTPPCKLGVEAT